MSIRKIRRQNSENENLTNLSIGRGNLRKIRSQQMIKEDGKLEQKNSSCSDEVDGRFNFIICKKNRYTLNVKHGKLQKFEDLFIFLVWFFSCFNIQLEEELIEDNVFLLEDIKIDLDDNVYDLTKSERLVFLKGLYTKFFEEKQLILVELFAEAYVNNNWDIFFCRRISFSCSYYSKWRKNTGRVDAFIKLDGYMKRCDKLYESICEFKEKVESINNKYKTKTFEEMYETILHNLNWLSTFYPPNPWAVFKIF